MRKSKTDRNFDLIEFEDLYGENCSIQKSSLATQDAIWFGIDFTNSGINVRAHLTQDMVEKIIPILKNFVNTGEISND